MKRKFLFTICVVLALAASLIGTLPVSAQTIAVSTRLATSLPLVQVFNSDVTLNLKRGFHDSLVPQLQVDGLSPGPAAETINEETITVNTSADNTTADGFCSMREAITNANNDLATYPDCATGAGADTISFAANYTITLIGAQLPVISSMITINGNGSEHTILQAQPNPNTAMYRVLEVANTGNLTLNNLTVRHGQCNGSCPTSASGGGGIFNGGTLAVTNSTIFSNSAGFGGGLYNAYILKVTNSTLSANSAPNGGGIYNGYILTVTNSTLFANSAPSGFGGGIGNGGTLTVTNSTLSANSASHGGGIYHQIGAAKFYNTIVANNSTGLDCAQAGTGTFTADSYNLDTDGSCDNATQRTTAEINLQPLANNGGPTQTMALGTGSLAIDAGDDATCAPTDQRGMIRLQGSHCDIGAVEYGNMTGPAVLSIMRVDPNPTKESHVGFTVTFSEAVSGVDTSDFNLRATSDITGAGLTSVSGVGSTYLAIVSAGSYNGSNIGLIDLNSASPSQLETLPGIGPTIAQQIIDYRTLKGPFLQIEEIMNVPGIGLGTFQRIQNLITVRGPFLRLDVVDDDTIKNGNNIPLGGPGLENGNFTSGEVYRLIRKNGADTTGVFRPSNGLLYLKNALETGFADIAINYGIPGDDPVVGDWDGNGTTTIGIYRSGYFYLRNENTPGFAENVFSFGQPGDQPIAGDWNGDGVDSIGVYRPANGQFLLRNSNSEGTADASFYLGNVGDVGIVGDWDGDGFDTTGVFRPSNGIVYLKNKNETGFADVALHYGIPGDKPVMGDWNNDGIDTIGVYRNGLFYLRNENTSGFAEIVFGLGNPGDMPIAGNWDGKP